MFLRKNKLMGSISKSTFFLLEKQLFNKASGVNVVSEGFPLYYEEKGIDTSNWSFFPNGVDKEFIGLSSLKKDKLRGVKTIMYAGNIGGGQGLDKILPHVAKLIGDRYRFLIVGDGSTNLLLRKAIKSENVNNIEILSPVNRNELIENYLFADILFLHLNDIPAFRRVLPSKIFEYVALRKPIVAGLSGYSAQFMADNVPSAIVFSPGDVDGCVYAIKKIENIKSTSDDINMFIKKYSREKIMNKMAEHILTSMLIKP
jgi:glycosyltransferase involved in cell wall biosynthesis